MRAELQEMTEQERLIQEANVLRQSEVGSRGRKYRLARRQQLENPVMEVHHKILQCQMEEIHKFVATLSQSSGIVHKKDFETLKTNLDRINSRLGTLEEVIKVESESTRLPKLFSKALSKMEVLEYTVMTHVGADGWVVLPQSPPDALSAPQRAAQSLQRKICGVLSTAVHDAAELSSRAAKLLGTSIGKVLSLEEQSSPVYSSPFPMAKAAEADSAVQIDLGEQDVTVTITVRWALN